VRSILVYVAGGVRGQTAQPIEGVAPQDWHAIVDANLTGAFLCARAVAPGMKRQGAAASYSPEFRAAFAEHIAMRRVGTPEDIAYAVMFLASDYASWITGQVLPVTGSPLV